MVKNLKLLREKLNISQQKLAEQIGVSQQSINKYENHNIEPDINTLISLADYFNVSVDYLVGRQLSEEDGDGVLFSQKEYSFIMKYRKLPLEKQKCIDYILNLL